MIKYKKLKIKNIEEELDVNDIDSLDRFNDIPFANHMGIINSAMVYSYIDSDLKHRIVRLNKNADWIIREYEEELYLIPLKKINRR